MGLRVYSSEVSADTTVVTTAETVVATISGVGTSLPGEKIRLSGQASITLGTATTALTWRIRRDSVTGTVVNDADPVQIETAAASTEDHNVDADDSFSGEVAGQTYVLTVQQTAATGNGTVLNAYLKAEVG